MKQYCELCDKRCPLDTLGCGKGRQAYASELLLGNEAPHISDNRIPQSERVQHDGTQSDGLLAQSETIPGSGAEIIQPRQQPQSQERLPMDVPMPPEAFEGSPDPRHHVGEIDGPLFPMNPDHSEELRPPKPDELQPRPPHPTVPEGRHHEPSPGEPPRPPVPDESPSANVPIGAHYPPRQGEPHQPPVHDEPPQPPVQDEQHRPSVPPGPHHPPRPGEPPFGLVQGEPHHSPVHGEPPHPPVPGEPHLPPHPPGPHHPPMPGGPLGPGRGRLRPEELLRHAEDAGTLELLDMCHRELHRPEVGVARGQERAIAILAQRGEMSQRELQDMLRIQPASMSELIYKLERKGCLTRERSEDRRANLLCITEAGREAAADMPTLPDEDLLSSLTMEEREQLTVILRKLLADWVTRYAPPEPEARPV